MENEKSLRERLLEAILPHVVFDGWNDKALEAACAELGIDLAAAKAVCPRGVIDLAKDYHLQGDANMVAALESEDLSQMRFRDRVIFAVRKRLELADKELVRQGSALFALPYNATDAAQLLWGTSDAIWNALGDTSRDGNWYSKRATLSAVYGSVILYWLGDDSEDGQATWEFLDRRIENVMQFEKMKAGIRKLPIVGVMFEGLMTGLKAPDAQAMQDVPGVWREDKE